MYAISNKQREDIIKLLAALRNLPGDDTRTANIKRMAGITINKLNKAKFISNEDIKHF
jgi:hypothetical protein